MPEQHLFEYAVIRVVPKVEREEFLNVGVVVYCADEKFLGSLFALDEERLKAFCNECGIIEIEAYLRSFERICKGGPDSGPIGKLNLGERFRWLTATRSTILQTSKVHAGLSADVPAMLNRLFDQLVTLL